ncbi:hypothetical protein V6N13_043388 [Hibiscus sabdariffa]|uniref:Uncharacterized protein n=1 Tax=Hibiscus sabdariffa TaxID=183260 RepID=A0ABR2G1R9_9ROSI
MATEAEIIPEPISVLKAEEEISKPSLDLKKSEGGLAVPAAGTYESSDKSENVELGTNNGVETLNTVSQGNPEISEGESFSISPEVSKVSETCGMSDHSTVDDTPFKAGKIAEDDEKISKMEEIANNDSSPEEKLGSIGEEMSQNAEIEYNKQEANLEVKKQASIGNPDPIIDSSNEANEIVTKAGHSSNIQEELEDKSIEEKKDTEPEKLPAAVEKGEDTEATYPIETPVISDSTGDILTSKVAETSEIKDHEPIPEISEVAKKELQNENPYEVVACIHEPATEVGEKLEEVSKEPEIDEHPKLDISSSSTVKESIKEDESIPLKSIEKASSSTDLEDSTSDTKEKTLVEESTNNAELESAPVAPETEEKKQETYNVVPTEESSLATTGHDGACVDGADIAVEPADSSVSCEKDKEISREEDGMQDKVPYEHSETPLPQATNETLMEEADNPTLDNPKIESKETGPEHLPEGSFVHTEQETGKCISVAETLKDEQSSNLGFVKEKIEDGKPLDETTDLGEASGICRDVEKVIQAEDDLAKNLTEQETLALKGFPDQISEVINMNVHEEQSKETTPELSKSQADETISNVQNQETEEKINEEPEDKLEDELKANEVSKAAILPKEVEDYTSVSNECLKEGDAKEHVEAKNLEVEEDSTKDREASLVVEREERKQNQGSGEPESVQESEEKIKDIVHESMQHCQDKSDETVTKVEAETSLDNTKMNEELVETSQETSKSDTIQETKQVENPQQEVEKTEPVSEPEVNEAEQTKVVPETSSESIPTSTAELPSKDEEIEAAHLSDKIGEEMHKVAEIVKHDSTIEEEEVVVESEPKAVSVEKTIVDEGLQNKEPEDQIQTTTSTTPYKDALSDSKQTAEICVEKEEMHKIAEIVKHDSTIEEEEESEPKSVSVEETIVDEGLQNKEPEDQIQTTTSTTPSKDDLSDSKQTAEICVEKEDVEEGKKDETGAARAIEVEEQKDQSSASASTEAFVDQETSVAQASLAVESREIENSALPSEKHETMETEPQKDESPPKIQEQTPEVEEASNVVETSEKAFDNELIKEKLVKASSGENQNDNTSETIVNEVSKEELLEVKEVTETSYLTSELEELVKDGYGEDELKDKLIKDKALETTQTEEDVTEAQKISENEIIEKQIVCEDKTAENPRQASSVTPIEEESNLELSQAGQEGAKGSDNQISRELEPIENTEITSSIVKEHAPIDLQDKVAESSQKAEVEDVKEVYPEEADIGHGGDNIIDNSGKKITEVLTSVEDSTKVKELKDEHTVEKTNETLKIPAYESEKDGANNNVEKEIAAEDQTVKDQEHAQVSVKEATIVPEEAMEKPEAIDLQPVVAKEISHGEEKTGTSVVEINPEQASASSGNLSLSDLLQRSADEKIDVADRVIEERELTISKEEAHVEDAETIPAKEPKIDDVPGGDEHNRNDSGSDAPVIVEAPRDTEIKPHKKSQNILSGVGSKVKNSISKVKKAITGKSSKEPKATSSKNERAVFGFLVHT